MMSDSVLFYTLAFGRREYVLQSQLLLLSLLSHRTQKSVFRVYTDQPDYFAHFEGSVEIIPLSLDTIRQRIEDHGGYVFAVKLFQILEVTAQEPYAATVFLDTDIVATRSLEMLENKLQSGAPLMYCREQRYAKESKKEYWRTLQKIDLRGYRLDRHSAQWNSGVVGLPGNYSSSMQDAAYLLDQLCGSKIGQHTLEQVAISIVLENQGRLAEARDGFIHYHPNKSAWLPLAEHAEAMRVKGDNLAKMLEWFSGISTFPDEAPVPPPRLQRMLNKWRNSLSKRLHRLA